ncbi:MAG TPA: response regulator [Polyangiaceae bacterium]|nr:response regulator [Polyangiaceae bacterium]
MISEESLLAGVVDLLPVGVWIARAPSGELVFANRMFKEIMGMEARDDVAVGGYSEPYGIRTREGAPYPEAQMPFVRALVERTTVLVDDITIARTDGRNVHVLATARPIFSEDEIAFVVIAFQDVTAEVEAERARARADERLQASRHLESLGTLAAGVAHDFNNVLTSVGMIAGDLRRRETDAARVADLRQIETAVDSAAQLTRSLLTFGRAGAGRALRFDLAELLRAFVDLARRTFDKSIAVELDVRGTGTLAGDPAQIEQLVMNLAMNARDAMPAGGTLRIVVTDVELLAPQPPLEPGRHVVLVVEDSGPGIPPAIRDKVFEPYFTTKGALDATGAQVPRGTGLGLATAFGVVKAYGGLIEIEDAVPHGARFRITLPIAGPAVVDRSPDSRPHPEASRGRETILVVDDEPMIRRITQRTLEALGYSVIEAKDGVDALEAFARERARIDAVLLDGVMPKKGGLEVLAELRRLAPSLPVVFMSGRLAPGDEARVLEHGAAALLAKPFTTGALGRALAAALQGTGGADTGGASTPARRDDE